MPMFSNVKALTKKIQLYDFIIVGAGLFGSVCAYELNKLGYRVLVLEKRNHVGGNIFTRNIDGINVHVYGAHIFHTSDKFIWEYVNKFAKFNNFINSPLANYRGEIYNLPFNMYTFKQIWPDIQTVDDAVKHIENEKRLFGFSEPKNLEEQAITMVGKTIYQKLVKEYTEKQWGKRCDELPSFIIKRLPLRFEYNNNYFNDAFQGIPIGGYSQIIESMLYGIDVILNFDFNKHKEDIISKANKIIYTGPIDEFFDYRYGRLEYRSLQFQTKRLEVENFQSRAVVNYTSHEVEFTRIIEHKHFEQTDLKFTIISEEYPKKWEIGDIPFYTINDDKNNCIYKKYEEHSKKTPNIIFGGRLGQYKYFDMDDTIMEALKLIKNISKEK